MGRDCFWLTDAQFETIAAHLPRDTRGKPRVDDRRVISGIIHVLTWDGGGWMRRVSTDPARRSTTASSAGRPRACGSTCSTRWPMPVVHPLTC